MIPGLWAHTPTDREIGWGTTILRWPLKRSITSSIIKSEAQLFGILVSYYFKV